MIKWLVLIAVIAVGTGVVASTSAIVEKVEFVPHWYQPDKQQKMSIVFPDGVKKMTSVGNPNHHIGVDVVNPFPTHASNLPQDISFENMTKSQIVDVKKKLEEQKALEILRKSTR